MPEHDTAAVATTPRCGSAARPARWVTRDHRGRAGRGGAAADAAGEPLLVLGGGSNLVVADDGLRRHGRRGRDQRRRGRRRATTTPTCGGVLVTVAAGEAWDDLVAHAVERGWVGIEALSGIPGLVGATPIQNVGAYGQEVAQTIARCGSGTACCTGVRTFANADCGFGYRTSRFKADPGAARRPRRHLPVPPGQPRRPGAVRRARPHPRRRARASARRSPTSARRCSGCAAARAWCSTPPTTTPGAPARSSPTRSSTPADAARGRPGLAAGRRPGQDQRRLADRAGRLRQGVRRRAGRPLDQAHPRAHQPRRRHHRELLALAREVRDGVEATVRHPAGQRAGAGRLRAVAPQTSDGAGDPDAEHDQRDEHRRSRGSRCIVHHDPHPRCRSGRVAAVAVDARAAASISPLGLGADAPSANGAQKTPGNVDAAAGEPPGTSDDDRGRSPSTSDVGRALVVAASPGTARAVGRRPAGLEPIGLAEQAAAPYGTGPAGTAAAAAGRGDVVRPGRLGGGPGRRHERVVARVLP